jgi:uncharacterized membrane protein HdeD (DUF308 family)
MAILGACELVHGLAQCKKYKSARRDLGELYDKHGTLVNAANIIDIILGVALVVLGVLALMHILPLPANMAQPFGWCAVAGGGINLLASSGKGCISLVSSLSNKKLHYEKVV